MFLFFWRNGEAARLAKIRRLRKIIVTVGAILVGIAMLVVGLFRRRY